MCKRDDATLERWWRVGGSDGELTMMTPSILMSLFSYSQIWTRVLLCRNLKTRLIGIVMMRFTRVAMAPP